MALRRKTRPGPPSEKITPASAGPMARAALTETLPSDAASGISSRGTSSGWMAWNAGDESAAPAPSRKVRINSVAGLRCPVNANTAISTPIAVE